MNPLVAPDPGLYIWTIVTFLLLVVAFIYLAWRPLKATLQAREDSIRKSLDDARQAREELQRLRRRVRADAGRGPGGSGHHPLAHARGRQSVPRRDEGQGAGRSGDIVKNAERRIEMETARALQQIRAEAVEFSVAIASKILQRNVSKEDNERLIEETFRQIESTRPS